jgi:hypothetical protein
VVHPRGGRALDAPARVAPLATGHCQDARRANDDHQGGPAGAGHPPGDAHSKHETSTRRVRGCARVPYTATAPEHCPAVPTAQIQAPPRARAQAAL